MAHSNKDKDKDKDKARLLAMRTHLGLPIDGSGDVDKVGDMFKLGDMGIVPDYGKARYEAKMAQSKHKTGRGFDCEFGGFKFNDSMDAMKDMAAQSMQKFVVVEWAGDVEIQKFNDEIKTDMSIPDIMADTWTKDDFEKMKTKTKKKKGDEDESK